MASFFSSAGSFLITVLASVFVFGIVIFIHELGHFLAFIAGNVDKTASFQSIFAAEKANVTAFNKAYVTQNASEYFAESVKDYILNNASLKSSRPQTYAAVQNALNQITDAQIAKIQKIYGAFWN